MTSRVLINLCERSLALMGCHPGDGPLYAEELAEQLPGLDMARLGAAWRRVAAEHAERGATRRPSVQVVIREYHRGAPAAERGTVRTIPDDPRCPRGCSSGLVQVHCPDGYVSAVVCDCRAGAARRELGGDWSTALGIGEALSREYKAARPGQLEDAHVAWIHEYMRRQGCGPLAAARAYRAAMEQAR